MMRPNIALLMLFCCMPVAALAQSARLQRTISLPAGVSVPIGPFPPAASVSPAGNLVAAICSDRVVRVWSTRSGEVLRSLNENSKPPSAVQFSADGRLLAIAYEIAQYEEGVIKIFDVGSWKVQQNLAAPFTMSAVAFSPDNRRFAFSDRYTEVWDLSGQNNLTDISPPFGGSAALSFSPDGRLIATADGDGFVRIYDATTGTLRGTPTEFLLEPFTVAFAPGGKSLVVGGMDKSISIIGPENGKVLRTLSKQPGLILSLDVSPDGKQVAVVYGSAEHFLDVHHLALWDLEKGTVLADFQKSGITITGGAFVGDRYVLSTTSGNQLTLWSIP